MTEKTVIEAYVDQSDWRGKENANEAYSISGLSGHIARTAVAKYALNDIYTPEIRDAHLGGTFYIHDLGLGLEGYCVGLDLKQLLTEGLVGVVGKTASAPPKHFRTALGQLVNWIFLISQEVAGAVAISSFDTFLAPFVRADGLTYEQVKQDMQEFIYNINQSTRIAFQTPFSNVTMDLTATGPMAEEHAIVGGKKLDTLYGEYQHEMDMINSAFAEVMTRGDAQGNVFTFPIPTYNITKNFNWENPVLYPLWKMTAKYGIPYFANFVNSDMQPEDVRSMCCRLRLDTRQLLHRGGLFSSNPTTGSIGVVTINLPHIARETKDEGGGSELFYKKLIAAMDLAALALNIKRTVVETNTKRGLFPYMERSLRHVKENMGTYWANHFNSIGLIGMNECVELLTSENITEPNGAWKAEEILDEMLSHLKFLQQQYGVMFNLEATPAETATYVLAKTDLKRWPDMLHQGTPEAPYYTNSALPPVNFTSDLWEYMRAVDNILPKFTGGSVVHVYLGEALPDPLSVKELVKHIATSYKVPYFSITPTFSICPIHGYLYGAHEYCPKCDAESIARQETNDAD